MEVGDSVALNVFIGVRVRAKHGNFSALVVNIEKEEPLVVLASLKEVAKLEIRGLKALKPVVVEFRGYAVRDSAGAEVTKTVVFFGVPEGGAEKSLLLY